MNDPKRNELLSAYLDGELTAGEQAEVERLLDDDPAARQLLEELRSLSVALQTLPREELGEDLSEKVLRAAERRVLLEGLPEPADRDAVPLSREIFARVFNTRVIAYVGITVALAVVIVLLDGYQNRSPIGDANKEIALSEPEHPELNKQPEEEPGYPPLTQSTRDSIAESVRPPEMDRGPTMKAAPEPKSEALAEKSLKAAPQPPTLGFSARPGVERPSVTRAFAKGARPRGGEDMLVVQCDVTPEAFANNDFDKLLVSNGITRRRQFNAIDAPADGDIAKNKRYTAGKRSAGQNSVQNLSPLDSENANLVYIEATPEQIEAMLAAIGANRAAFSNVMVTTPHGRLETRAKGGRGIESGSGQGGLKKAEQGAAPRGGMGTFGAPPANQAIEEQKSRPRPAPNGNQRDDRSNWQDDGERSRNTEASERENTADKKQEKKDAAKPDGEGKSARQQKKDVAKQGRDGKSAAQRQTAQPSRPAPSRRVLFVLRIVPLEASNQASSPPAKANKQSPPPAAETEAEKK